MANTVIGASVEVEFSSVGNMRKALKEANQELIRMQAQFGETSSQALAAAEKVGSLKDQIKTASEVSALFDPGKKFQTVVDFGAKIAAGFSAVQGAMALVGVESESLQKTMVKLQGAMALAQGLSELKEFGESWDRLTAFVGKATKGLSNFQKALLATGVGVLVAVIAAWKDIAKAIGLASFESAAFAEVQKAANSALADASAKAAEATSAIDGYKKGIISKEKALDIYNQTLGDSLGKTDDINIAEQRMIEQVPNYLKAVQLKAKAQAAFAKSAELSIEYEEKLAKSGMTEEQALKAAKAADQLSLLNLGINERQFIQQREEIERLNKIANEAFQESTALTQKIGADNINKQYENNKKSVQNKSQTNDKLAKLEQQRNEALGVLEEARLKLMTEKEAEFFQLEKKRIEDIKKLEAAGIKEGSEERLKFDESYRVQKQNITDKYDKQEKEKEKEFQDELNAIIEETRLAGVTNVREKERADLTASYQERLTEIEKNENYNAEQRSQLRAALLTQQKQAEDALNEKFRQEDLEKRSSDLLAESSAENLSFAERLDKIKEREALESQIVFENDKARTDFQEQNSKARKAIIAAETAYRIEQAQKAADALQGLSDVVGKETAAGKALAVAAATINTYLAASKALAGISTANPLGAALAIAQAATVIGVGLKNVREILKVKVPGGGGSGPAPTPPPTMQTTAPVTPALSPAVQGQALNADAINNLGNTALRAYVMNSDIQNNNQRNAYLQRNARLG